MVKLNKLNVLFICTYLETYFFKINTGVQNIRSRWPSDDRIGFKLSIIRNEIS